ncbi:hypothetical protein [Pedobacter immunditicola]|uniref:hypothetical protein n=1 Tax=Pedobacter immunditicola TaxID=3133440 RepID=UPI00309A9A23
MNEFAQDPSNLYRTAYFEKLNNQISIIEGKFIPVYDVVPDDAKAPYIIISSLTLTPTLYNSGYGYSANMTIDIVTRFASGGGKRLVDSISNEIFKVILTRNKFYVDDTWNIYTSKLDNTRYIESQSGTGVVIRKLISFENKIQQL